MKDILSIIHQKMIENETIKNECQNRIKFYLYPETGDMSKPFITIRPLQPPHNSGYASDKNMTCEHFIQIDVQSYERIKCKEIQKQICKIMNELGFSQQAGGLDEYFEETKRFVDARRYQGTTKIYDNNY